MIRVLIVSLFLFAGCVHSQPHTIPAKGKKQWAEILQKIGMRNHEVAIQDLEKFVRKFPKYQPAQKQLADTYLRTHRYQEAKDFIEKVLSQGEPQDKIWWSMSAEAYEQLRMYPEAITSMQKLRDWPGQGGAYKKLVDDKIKHLEFVHQMRSNPVPYEPVNVGAGINTDAFELYPFLSPEGDKMYFTRKDIKEDLYVSEKIDGVWNQAQPLPFNTNENEGAQTISADGKLILFTACNRPDGLGSCDIFYSFLVQGQWTEPRGTGAPINSTDWESQPFLSANGRAMIFSSNRPGGRGGKDLYISYLNKDNQWLEPQNMGSTINTSGDEETPFLHADGKTLFFSSNGHLSIGGKDLFMSQLNEKGEWSEPVNLGYPINTESDESSIYVDLDGKTAYIASAREGGHGKLDIYQFDLHDQVAADPAVYVKAIVKDANSKELINTKYSIFNIKNNELFSFGQTGAEGSFLISIPASETFRLEIDKSNYVFHSEQFQAQKGSHQEPYILNVFLQPIQQGASIVLKNVQFDTDSYTLTETSFPELQKLLELLLSDTQIVAVIKGHTDNIGTPAYNLELSQKRAQSVVNYLIEQGVDSNRITAQGYGDTQPIAPNDSDTNRQLNRRTEFEITKK